MAIVACTPMKGTNGQAEDYSNSKGASTPHDSFPQAVPSPSRIAQQMTFRSKIITAQHSVLTTYRRHAIRTIHRMKIVKADEVKMMTSWKRFAISLSNLFAFEKDLEGARVGSSKHEMSKADFKKEMAYSKLTKNVVDDCLRKVAKRKLERTTPALDCVGEMTANYLVDLFSVDSCLVEYGRAVEALENPVKKVLNAAYGCATEDAPQGAVKGLGALKEVALKMAGKNVASPTPAKNDGTGFSTQNKAARQRLAEQGKSLEHTLAMLLRSSSIRSARAAYMFCRIEAGRAANLRAEAINLGSKIQFSEETLAQMVERNANHVYQKEQDDVKEIETVRRMFELADDDDGSYERLRARVLEVATEKVGRWDGDLSLALMKAAGVDDAEVSVEETSRDLRLVRKYAIGLRQNVERCVEAVGILNAVVLGAESAPTRDDQSLDASVVSTKSNISSSASYEAMKINRKRELFIASMARLLSRTPVPVSGNEEKKKQAALEARIVSQDGVSLSDWPGWLYAADVIEKGTSNQTSSGRCGEHLIEYQKVREADVAVLLARMNQLLADYHRRVEGIESCVYMSCVGIQLEKHYLLLREHTIEAFEQHRCSEGDMQRAIDRHLAASALKEDLDQLAARTFQRAKDTSMERVIQMTQLWVKHEEQTGLAELKALGTLIREMEKHVTKTVVESDGGAHLYVLASAVRPPQDGYRQY